ncbi:MFS_1_like domain-containing protein [Caerostris darwini]|uniref:MFS_1_like domain-containing protein n=1 Tax=Caerostris darwini TaxID=1538125 RepID=A0AAV4W0Y7_9ARAC|nr:MFS_1_like domain-containing protein [Caerostris darwini]
MDTKAVTSYENGSFVAETSLASIPEAKIEDAKVAIPDNKNDISSDTTHFTINLCKDYKISINKPMINLKLALFTYYGAGSFMPSFLTVLYKQRGVTLAELSTFTIIAPLFQFIGSTVSGIVADKIGRSKPVLFANLFLVTMTVLAILLTPKIDRTNCNPTQLMFSAIPGIRKTHGKFQL